MRMRSYRRNVAGWERAVDRYVAPRFPRTARMLRTRRRPLLLAVGALLLVMGMALPSSIAFVAGMLVLGAAAPDALPWTHTTAMVHAWESPRKNRGGHP